MNFFSRLWTAVFGPYMSLHLDNANLLMQRGYYGQLLISARDDAYGIQILLNREQANELLQWLQRNSGPLNSGPPRGKLISLPTKALSKPSDK